MAFAIGFPVSAATTRPTIIRAGSTARITGFELGVLSVSTLMHLPGEPRVIDREDDPETLARPRHDEPALGVGERRAGPGRQVLRVLPPQEFGTIEAKVVGIAFRIPQEAAHRTRPRPRRPGRAGPEDRTGAPESPVRAGA